MADRELIYLGAKREVLAMDPRTGEIVWQQRLDEWFGSFQSLFVHGDTLLVAHRGQLYCFDRWRGERQWKQELDKRMKNAPIMIAAAGGGSDQQMLQQAAAQQAQQAAAAGAAAGAAG